MTRTQSQFSDPELRAVFDERPDLLGVGRIAVAAVPRARPHRFRTRRRLLGAAATVAVGLVVMLVAPWQNDGGGIVEAALAAVGDRPVLHVVTAAPAPTSAQLLEIETGRTVLPTMTVEVWFDEERQQKRVLTRIGGRILDDELQTRTGWVTRGGPVYTCAWIAAHPVEAEKANVSCDSRDQQPEQPRPSVDAALLGFVDGYRSSLEAGAARVLSHDQLDGRPVTWLELRLDARVQRVAIDRDTAAPVRVEEANGGYDVLTIESVARSAPDFLLSSSPLEQRFAGSVVASESVNLREAVRGFDAPLVWAGTTVDGLELSSVQRKQLKTTYAQTSEQAATTALGIELQYGDRRGVRRVAILQAPSCELAFGWFDCTPPPRGHAYYVGPAFGALLTRDGVFVTIRGSTQADILTVARQLEALPAAQSSG